VILAYFCYHVIDFDASEGSMTSVMSFRSRATQSSSSTTLLASRQEVSRNFMKYSLSYSRRRKQKKSRTKSTQYGAFYHSCHRILCMAHWELIILSGFVLLQMYLGRYWDWNRGSSMSSVEGMVRSLRISKPFIAL